MKTLVTTVLLALVLLFGSKTKAEENVGAPTSQSEIPAMADWIANQFHSYSTELTIGIGDLWSIPADGNLGVLSEVSGFSESAMDKDTDRSAEANKTGLNFNAQAFSTKMTLAPGTFEARWRKSDLWLVPAKKTEDVVVYKKVEFSGVFAHLSDLFVEPQKFLQLFNPFAPPGYGVAITTGNGFVLWAIGF